MRSLTFVMLAVIAIGGAAILASTLIGMVLGVVRAAWLTRRSH